MHFMKDGERINIRMVFKRLVGMENEAERRELDAWLNSHPHDRRWLESLDGGREYLRRREWLNRLDTEHELRDAMKRRFRIRWHKWIAAAAVLLVAGVWLYKWTQLPEPVMEVCEPGAFGAILVAGDGSLHDLLSAKDSIEVETAHYVVSDSNGLTYEGLTAETWKEETTTNRLVVSRGYEYMLTLCDGTKVWLNSESELEYPVVFQHGERRVKLKGEAYFEVVSDSLSPFVVEVERGFDVRVLGTRFNVKAYDTDERYETTLVSGRVVVEDSTGRRVALRPSEQFVLGHDGSCEVREVDVRYYLAWHEGWFYFHDEPLRQVLLMVERWYDVEFEYEDDMLIEEKRVTGKIRRFDDLEVLLDMLTKVTGVKFEKQEDRILLRK